MKKPLLNFLLASWIFLPSTYTHRDGVRVAQYEPLPTIPSPDGPYYERVYRSQHTHLYSPWGSDNEWRVQRWSRVQE